MRSDKLNPPSQSLLCVQYMERVSHNEMRYKPKKERLMQEPKTAPGASQFPGAKKNIGRSET